MNKKIVTLTSLIVLAVGLLSIILFKYYNLNVVEINNDNKVNSGLSVFIDGEESETIPVGKYLLDASKSYCAGGGRVKDYDSTQGTIRFIMEGADTCVVHFITVNGDVMITVSTDGAQNQLPSSSGYYPTLSCVGASAVYNDKYQRLEISSMEKGYTACNLDYTKSSFKNLKTEVEKINPTNNHGYRYVGKDPNNWIWFNNEMWRIIGSIPVCTSATINTTTYSCTQATSSRPRLVKIIRSDSIGGLAYHSSQSNNIWGNGNTLYTLLNSHYWGKSNISGQSPCIGYQGALATCNYTKIGIDPDGYYGKMVEPVYMNVGKLSNSTGAVYITSAYDSEIATVSKITNVGLLNATDYGYAADLAAAGKKYSGVQLSALSSYEQYNWLFGAGYYEWTMTPSNTSSITMNIHLAGYINSGYTDRNYTVRPVVYLDSSVYIISGDGSATNPYTIGM